MVKRKIINKKNLIITLVIINVGFLGGILWVVKTLYEEFYTLLPQGFYLWVLLFILVLLWLIYLLLRPKQIKSKLFEQLA
ncbi:MAG: hypothetical protein WCT00_06865, partial [Bacilli bacterium]